MRNLNYIITLAIASMSLTLCSQVVINSSSVTPFNCSAENLLDIKITNTASTDLIVSIAGTLQMDNGYVLCTVNAQSVSVPVGTINLKGMLIISDFNYSEHPIAQYLASSGKLLAGGYQLCIEISSPSMEFPTQNCFPLTSSYASFLQLIYPNDKSIISERNPLLTWAHSGIIPIGDGRETFELVLVEKGKSQSSEQALAENELLLNIPMLQSHTILYPVNAPSLNEGLQYAWRVLHKFDGVLIESSDAWWFEMSEWEDPRDIKYVDVTASKSTDIVPVYHSFYFRFDERYNSNELTAVLLDESGKIIKPAAENDSESSAVAAKKNGFNGYKLNLTPYHLKQGRYVLQISDAKGKNYRINIQYNK
jgi:hypothetical protein